MGKLSMWDFLREQFTYLELVESDLTGKTVIVTGANVGIGFETAKHFARMKPARLILACRDIARAEEAAKQIREETHIGNELTVWQLDLADFTSVRAFADKFEREGGGRLDLLVENAAVATHEYQRTKDRWEKTLQINHLSTALLALLLLPIQLRTQASGPMPRLVVVTSSVHYTANAIDGYSEPNVLEYINEESYCTAARMGQRYALSKLLSVFFVRPLASHLKSPSPLTVASVNPGLCHSSLTRNLQGLPKFWIEFYKYLVGRSTEMGSRTLVWAALGGKSDAVNGRYLSSCRVEEESDWSLGEEGRNMEANVWKETIHILKNVDPRIALIVKQYLKP